MPLSDDAPTDVRRNGTGRLWMALAILGLLATLALTLPRWLDTTNYRLIQLAAATPAGTPVALVSALVALIAVRRATTARRRWAALIATATATGLLGLHLALLAPLYFGTVPTAQPGPPLVILAQNFEYGSVDALAAAAASANADVIVLSDMGPDQFAALDSSPLRAQYPFRASANGAVVVMSKAQIRSVTDVGPGSAADLVRLQTTQLGVVDVLAFHPPAPYSVSEWRAAYRRVTAFIADRRPLDAAVPLVVVGDLNATSDHVVLRRLLDLGLRDAVEVVNGGYTPTWPVNGLRAIWGVPVPALTAIDHVLVGGQLAPTTAVTSAAVGSDHLAVIVSIRPRVVAPELSTARSMGWEMPLPGSGVATPSATGEFAQPVVAAGPDG